MQKKIDDINVGDYVSMMMTSRSIKGQEAKEKLGMPYGLVFESKSGKVVEKSDLIDEDWFIGYEITLMNEPNNPYRIQRGTLIDIE